MTPKHGPTEEAAVAETLPEQAVPEATASLEEAIARLRAERESLFDRLARLQAEFDNFRKRAAKENADFREFAVADAARALLPVIDSFDLALKAPANDGDNELRRGVELIRRQLDEALTRIGVKPIHAVGAAFDPRFHEAIEIVETSDVTDNHVIAELQRGYLLKDRLLRPAMVRVARNHK